MSFVSKTKWFFLLGERVLLAVPNKTQDCQLWAFLLETKIEE